MRNRLQAMLASPYFVFRFESTFGPTGNYTRPGQIVIPLDANWGEDQRWSPSMNHGERERLYRNWKKAVTRTFDWVDDDVL